MGNLLLLALLSTQTPTAAEAPATDDAPPPLFDPASVELPEAAPADDEAAPTPHEKMEHADAARTEAERRAAAAATAAVPPTAPERVWQVVPAAITASTAGLLSGAVGGSALLFVLPDNDPTLSLLIGTVSAGLGGAIATGGALALLAPDLPGWVYFVAGPLAVIGGTLGAAAFLLGGVVVASAGGCFGCGAEVVSVFGVFPAAGAVVGGALATVAVAGIGATLE